MCGGGGGGGGDAVDTYKGPPGPGAGIAGVPIGFGDYKDAARALLSTGQTYGQMAASAAQALQQAPTFTAPPAPQSAFASGLGQYIAAGGATPYGGQSPAMSAIGQLEAAYDPRTAATEMLQSYEPGYEARPLSYYTPNAMEQLANPPSPTTSAFSEMLITDPSNPEYYSPENQVRLYQRNSRGR
jgi:hypothetical protein